MKFNHVFAGAVLAAGLASTSHAALVLHYDFNNGDTVTPNNSGTLGGTGTVIGAGAFASTGPGGSGAIHLTGGQYINTNFTTATLGTYNGTFTASAIIRPDVTGGDHMVFGDNAATLMHLGIRNSQAYFGFYANDTPGNGIINAGQWYTLTFRYNSATQTQDIFINGVLDNSQ